LDAVQGEAREAVALDIDDACYVSTGTESIRVRLGGNGMTALRTNCSYQQSSESPEQADLRSWASTPLLLPTSKAAQAAYRSHIPKADEDFMYKSSTLARVQNIQKERTEGRSIPRIQTRTKTGICTEIKKISAWQQMS
jgi:hypothetical protein